MKAELFHDELIELQRQQLDAIGQVAKSVERAVKWLTISQYVLMGALLAHGWVVKSFVK